MRALLQRHRRPSNFVMSTSPPDFTKFPDGASPSLPDLPRVDSSMAKVELYHIGKIGMCVLDGPIPFIPNALVFVFKKL